MYDTIVIGSGQAGLAMGYYLKKHNHSFLILEKNKKVGEVWDNRYDSLVLFTPKLFSSLPGLSLSGDPHDYPTKDDIAEYLRAYATTFELPINLNTEVIEVKRGKHHFVITTDQREYEAKNVIIATGPFQVPHIPSFTNDLSIDVLQLHSSEYKNTSQLREGNVLVVGAGNSGAQIAVEISQEREVYLSTGHGLRYMPLYIGNRPIYWWFNKYGILKASSKSYIGRLIQKIGDPVFGLELKKAIKEGKVIVKERTIDCKDNNFIFHDNSSIDVHNVIWATGFTSNYNWLNISGVLNEKQEPMHHRGVTNVAGLYFLGLPWQHRRGSALLQGVGDDAKYIMELLKRTH